MKNTRLWQAPGSPIIQGRSRRERPFWRPWLGSLGLGALVVFLVGVLLVSDRDTSFVTLVRNAALRDLVPSLPGLVAGSALGTWLARQMGWSRPWLVGTVCGVALGWLGMTLW